MSFVDAPKPLRNYNKVGKPPQSVGEVHTAMLEMEKLGRNNTFSQWVRDPENTNWISLRYRDMFEEYARIDLTLAANAVAWMSQEWEATQAAVLLLRLFYRWNIASERFAFVSRRVADQKPARRRALVSLLLQGEPAETQALFLYHFCAERSLSTRIRVLCELAEDQMWDLAYSARVIVGLAFLDDKVADTEASVSEKSEMHLLRKGLRQEVMQTLAIAERCHDELYSSSTSALLLGADVHSLFEGFLRRHVDAFDPSSVQFMGVSLEQLKIVDLINVDRPATGANLRNALVAFSLCLLEEANGHVTNEAPAVPASTRDTTVADTTAPLPPVLVAAPQRRPSLVERRRQQLQSNVELTQVAVQTAHLTLVRTPRPVPELASEPTLLSAGPAILGHSSELCRITASRPGSRGSSIPSGLSSPDKVPPSSTSSAPRSL